MLCLQTEGPVPSPTGGASAETPVLLLNPAGTLPQRQHGLPGQSLHSAVAETDTNGRNHSLVTRPLRWQHQNTTVLMSQELLSSSPARAGEPAPTASSWFITPSRGADTPTVTALTQDGVNLTCAQTPAA